MVGISAQVMLFLKDALLILHLLIYNLIIQTKVPKTRTVSYHRMYLKIPFYMV